MIQKWPSPKVVRPLEGVLRSVAKACEKGSTRCAVREACKHRKELIVFLESFLVQIAADDLGLEVLVADDVYPEISSLLQDGEWKAEASAKLKSLCREILWVGRNWEDLKGAEYVSAPETIERLITIRLPRLLSCAAAHYRKMKAAEVADVLCRVEGKWRDTFVQQ